MRRLTLPRLAECHYWQANQLCALENEGIKFPKILKDICNDSRRQTVDFRTFKEAYISESIGQFYTRCCPLHPVSSRIKILVIVIYNR